MHLKNEMSASCLTLRPIHTATVGKIVVVFEESKKVCRRFFIFTLCYIYIALNLTLQTKALLVHTNGGGPGFGVVS